MRLDSPLTLLPTILACALACAPEAATTTDQSTSSTTDDTTASTPATTDDTTTDAPTTTDPTTTDPTTTTGDTTSETTSTTTGAPAGYCWGLDDDAPEPFLELYDYQGNQLGDGVTLPLECGVQGLWMFGLYPKFGGWDPMDDSVTFTLTVDVEGFDINPAGHFFSGDVSYYVGCDDLIGGVFGVVPVLPPDELADLSMVDGLTANMHVELHASGQTLTFDAMMPLSAPIELTQEGCTFGG
ncbi:hypothetical protein [Nannocystis sp. SCPEA4]|uniref:hypothetical protein n=1 Tax=Nannocystis sp. SCPEA4 TaxID=2996787 RepID=UPI00226EA72E|nr:hypothetical protein [Nannocystis sp. SCPEA4]MCY1059668.1 hypothetical protein [Nannocystis sp. SCPEA4]